MLHGSPRVCCSRCIGAWVAQMFGQLSHPAPVELANERKSHQILPGFTATFYHISNCLTVSQQQTERISIALARGGNIVASRMRSGLFARFVLLRGSPSAKLGGRRASGQRRTTWRPSPAVMTWSRSAERLGLVARSANGLCCWNSRRPADCSSRSTASTGFQSRNTMCHFRGRHQVTAIICLILPTFPTEFGGLG